MAKLKYKFAKIVRDKFWEDLEESPTMPCASKNEIITANWLLTGKQINSAGLFKIKKTEGPPRLSPEEYEQSIIRLCEQRRFSWEYNPKTWIFLICSWFKYSSVNNSNHLWGVLSDIAGIEDPDMLLLWAKNAKKYIICKTQNGTNLHEIIDEQILILISGKTKQPENTPEPKPDKKETAKKKTPKEPVVFSEVVERIYPAGVKIFEGNNHKPKTTPSAIEKEKNQIRLMIESDGETEENIMMGLEFLRALPDKNEKWAGWGKKVGSFQKLRDKWGEQIRANALNASQQQKRPSFMPKEEKP